SRVDQSLPSLRQPPDRQADRAAGDRAPAELFRIGIVLDHGARRSCSVWHMASIVSVARSSPQAREAYRLDCSVGSFPSSPLAFGKLIADETEKWAWAGGKVLRRQSG